MSDSCGDGNVVSEHTYKGNKVVLQIPHVHVAVFAARRTGFPSHVLRQNRPQRHAPNKESAHVSMRRTDHVVRPQINATTNGYSFLAASYINSTDDLALPVEFSLDPELELPSELHIIEEVEKRLIGRQPGGRNDLPSECLRIDVLHIHWDG